MDIILKQDVENLGNKNDIVSVRPGYANNFLFPQGMAIMATKSARKMVAEDIKQQAHKEQKFVDNANELATKLAAEVLTFTVKANDDKIYGSITTANIAEALQSRGYSIDRKNITVEAIKAVGEYDATIKLYKAIKGTVKIAIVAE